MENIGRELQASPSPSLRRLVGSALLAFTLTGDTVQPVSDVVTPTVYARPVEPDCALEPLSPAEISQLDSISHIIYEAAAKQREAPRLQPTMGTIDQVRQQRFERRQELAAEYGLTILNTDVWSEHVGRAATADEAISITKEYFSNFGVEITFQQDRSHDQSKRLQFEPVDMAELQEDTYGLKSDLQALIHSNGALPVELVRAAGLQEIRFVGGIKMREESSGEYEGLLVGGLAEPDIGRYYANIHGGVNLAGIFSHEFAHLLDHAYTSKFGCSVFNDPEHESLNPDGIEYGQKKYPPGLLEVSADYINVSVKDAVFKNFYATTNAGEDKATTAENLHYPESIPMIESPTLGRKAALALGRANDLVPSYISYLIAASTIR